MQLQSMERRDYKIPGMQIGTLNRYGRSVIDFSFIRWLAQGARTILRGVKTKEAHSYENELSTSGPLRISLIEMPDQVGDDV